LELKALQAALITSSRGEETQSELDENLDSYLSCLQSFQDSRAERSYQEAQYVHDLDVALDCLRSHISSGASASNQEKVQL